MIQVPATWVGSGATIALVPHTCLIFPENNTLACSPAQLVLYQTPGAHYSDLFLRSFSESECCCCRLSV